MKILVTFVLTSVFWLVAFMSGMISTSSGEGGEASAPATAERDPTPIHDAEVDRRDGDIVLAPDADPPLRMARSVEIGPNGLAVPVAGIEPGMLVDTYTQARAGGARRHDAIDIMAEAGTDVVAAAPGRLEKIFYSDGGGGKTLYVRSNDNRWIYYYAHLADYAQGLEEGQAIDIGQRLGTVGSSGNADPAAPHLHFAIHRMDEGEDWWEGRPVNPYPLLAGEREGG